MDDKTCNGKCASEVAEGENTKCTARDRLKKALFKYFEHSEFRPGQVESTLPAIHGHDVFVRMATGSGKSMCMFLVPLALNNVAIGIVISPLNALINQQVRQLCDAGVTAIGMGPLSSVCDVASGKYRFVFMSPETAASSLGRAVFAADYVKEHLAIVAVDEAHCIVDWGSDFRTSFSEIGSLRALTNAPFMALTATASLDTQSIIVESLKLVQPVVVSLSLDRPNIYLSVSAVRGLCKDLGGLVCMLKSRGPKTIIYTPTKNAACKVYEMLSKSVHGHCVSMYHASLTSATKAHIYSEFQRNGTLRCLVSTIAFGMGMDIRDVQFVIMYGAPSTVNLLHQLCGRAGRDGSLSRAHLFYSTRQKKLNCVVKEFCSSKENCRRLFLLQALGSAERTSGVGPCCDVCCTAIPCALNFEALPSSSLQKHSTRRSAVRTVNEHLKKKLRENLEIERESYMLDHPSYRMLGPNFVCPDSVIEKICLDAKFISSIEDLNMVTMRAEIKPNFFRVIQRTLSLTPTQHHCQTLHCHN